MVGLMNQFFEFSKGQMKALTVLAVLAFLGGSYKLFRDYYLRPAVSPQFWRVEVLEEGYRPTLTVDLNHVSADSLELIPGIGPVLSQRIIDYRQKHGFFASIDSLANVPGIGQLKLAQIRPYFKIAQP